jgi:hypothetical protein
MRIYIYQFKEALFQALCASPEFSGHASLVSLQQLKIRLGIPKLARKPESFSQCNNSLARRKKSIVCNIKTFKIFRWLMATDLPVSET